MIIIWIVNGPLMLGWWTTQWYVGRVQVLVLLQLTDRHDIDDGCIWRLARHVLLGYIP